MNCARIRSRLLLTLTNAALLAFAVACGSSSDGVVDPGANDAVDADSPAPDGGSGDAGALPAISVSPASSATIVSGAPVVLTAALVDSNDAIAWTLDGPGSISPATGTSTIYTPPASGAMGLATITASAGSARASSTVRVSNPPKRAVVAYAYAHDPNSASYTPVFPFSYNAAGGAISATRTKAGTYTMKFADLLLDTGDVQVTAFGSNARCTITGWGGETAKVACFDPAGAPADSAYTISVVRDDVYSLASTVAYARANDPTNPSYTPDANYSYNATGGEIIASRSAPGVYLMRFKKCQTSTGNVQVSAYDSEKSCAIDQWGGETVSVRCYDAAGNLADSQYTVSFVATRAFSAANVAAYAWANEPDGASYTPDGSYSYNSGGGAITATRSASGTYAIEFGGLRLARGNVKVSAYGSGRYCNVASWGESSVGVRCYNSAGILADSSYTVMITLDNRPVASRVAAYAWANDAAKANYTPIEKWAYKAWGPPITATRSATGTYAMTFPGLVFGSGDVQVTAYQSNATCSVENWAGSTVDVRCYDPAGALVDSRYAVTVFLNDVPTDADTVAYAWANDATSMSYTPDPAHSYNSAGGAIKAARLEAGRYTISFSSLSIDGASVQVSGYGGSNSCVGWEWDGDTIEIRCHDAAGALADSQYTVQVMKEGSSRAASSPGYAWANEPSSASYAPSSSHAYNASALPITATRSAVGTYAMRFEGLGLTKGIVKVSAYGSAARCNVHAWRADGADVRCYDSSGALVDTRYTLLYTE